MMALIKTMGANMPADADVADAMSMYDGSSSYVGSTSSGWKNGF